MSDVLESPLTDAVRKFREEQAELLKKHNLGFNTWELKVEDFHGSITITSI